MNILLCNHYAGSHRHGMEYRPYYLAREWVRRGHHVTIVAASRSHLRQQNPSCAERAAVEWIDGIRYVWLRTPPYAGNGIRRVANMFSFVGQLLRRGGDVVGDWRPDAVIASSTYPLDILPTHRLARRYHAKLLFEVHDLWPLTPMELGGMSRWHPFIMSLQWAEDFAYRRADRVVSLLPKADSYMRQRGMAADKFQHIPNGVDLGEWERCDQKLPESHERIIRDERQAGRFLVGYAGGHGLSNALEFLLAAAEQLRDQPVTFLLVGQGPEKPTLEQIAQVRGLTNVRFLAPLPKAAVPSFLTDMDALYLGWRRQPLYRFGISANKLFDYMMAARPVIHSIETAADPVAESGCGVCCAPEDPAAIARATRELLERHPDERQRMGRLGREYVLRHHTYATLADRFLEVLT
ncbi:MAG: glycosyltransferase family 4 protein [Candidatus Anammoximicrobium sp.]|nr:glycosyltransferase family 4 protein [Candidatus Anammoximicrobium sp.]